MHIKVRNAVPRRDRHSFVRRPAPLCDPSSLWHNCDMADCAGGRTVCVTTQRLGGGLPRLEFYCVAESDLVMAEAVIKAALVAIPDARVEAVALRTPAEVEAMGLERGE